jgi:hypothetical protein
VTHLSVAEYRSHGFKAGNKYRNKRTFVDNRWFDSKLEAQRYLELKNLWELGQVAWFTCQVPFRLPGNITYRADFLVVWKERPLTVEDCKGVKTRVSINKIKQVEEIYGITIEIISKSRYRAVPCQSARKASL